MMVRFVSGMAPYQAGEVAAFSEERARQLIRGGVAESYKAPPAPPTDKMERGGQTKDLEDHTVDELQEIAKERGIERYYDLRKGELIEALGG